MTEPLDLDALGDDLKAGRSKAEVGMRTELAHQMVFRALDAGDALLVEVRRLREALKDADGVILRQRRREELWGLEGRAPSPPSGEDGSDGIATSPFAPETPLVLGDTVRFVGKAPLGEAGSGDLREAAQRLETAITRCLEEEDADGPPDYVELADARTALRLALSLKESPK